MTSDSDSPETALDAARFVEIRLPVVPEDIEDGDIPAAIPGLQELKIAGVSEIHFEWVIVVGLETGQIQDWPSSGTEPVRINLKVTHSGTYTLLDANLGPIVRWQGYVPNKLIPGSWGDYVSLTIDANGQVTNWPAQRDLSEFTGDPDAFGDLTFPT